MITYKFDARKERIWFTSDWHYNHTHFGNDAHNQTSSPIWKERGYSSCSEMNEHIIQATNECVGPNDILIHHGDVALRSKTDDVKALFSRLNCQRIYLVWGNHESATFPIYKEKLVELGLSHFQEVYPLKWNNVIFCGPEITVSIRHGEGKHQTAVIHCAHFPKSIWDNMKYDNYWMTCGHSHLGFKETRPDSLDFGKIIDVGWDEIRRPWSFDEVKAFMDKKPVLKKDKNH